MVFPLEAFDSKAIKQAIAITETGQLPYIHGDIIRGFIQIQIQKFISESHIKLYRGFTINTCNIIPNYRRSTRNTITKITLETLGIKCN